MAEALVRAHVTSGPGIYNRMLLGQEFAILPIKMSPLNNDNGHLDELEGALAVLEGLGQVQDLTPHHAHLLLKEMPVKPLVRLKTMLSNQSFVITS